MALLELRNITAGYDKNIILRDFNLQVERGQFVSLLDMVKQYASLAGSQIPNLDEVLSAIDEMKANGQGFMVRGTIEDNGRRQNVTASLIPVDNFVEMDSAVLKLSVSSEENTIVAIGMPEGQSGVPMFILNLLSDPAKPSLTAEMSIGEASISFRLFPEDGLQKMTFDVSSDGEDAWPGSPSICAARSTPPFCAGDAA